MQTVLFVAVRPASMHFLHSLLSVGTLIIWIGAMLLLLHGRRFYQKLTDLTPLPQNSDILPRLSILVPACNEASTIEEAMRSILSLDYPNLEIIAVNDRSTDGTGVILEKLSQQNPVLKVLHISSLPAGWLGKNHALQVAADGATGDWLLFTDADVVFESDALRRAVGYATTANIDHLVITPRCDTRDFWERLFVSYFGLMFWFRSRAWTASDPRRSAYVGLGAFNMVRTCAYRAFGGHRALPMEVADDVKLGKIIKQSGFKTQLLDGSDLISVRWVVGLPGVINSLAKNAFAGFEYSLPAAIGGIVALAYTGLYPLIALLLPGHATRLMALAVLVIMAIGARAVRSLSGADMVYGLAYPLASILLMYIIVRATWFAYKQNGIIWRGTLYPLDELRRGVV
jgi:cellulose synthase/poly-beta-1,6-N-acetylglucosamine synthase-like glycosyltransferase